MYHSICCEEWRNWCLRTNIWNKCSAMQLTTCLTAFQRQWNSSCLPSYLPLIFSLAQQRLLVIGSVPTNNFNFHLFGTLIPACSLLAITLTRPSIAQVFQFFSLHHLLPDLLLDSDFILSTGEHSLWQKTSEKSSLISMAWIPMLSSSILVKTQPHDWEPDFMPNSPHLWGIQNSGVYM